LKLIGKAQWGSSENNTEVCKNYFKRDRITRLFLICALQVLILLLRKF